MSLIFLINADNQEKFEAMVFGQNAGNMSYGDGSHTYVYPLSIEEEVALCKKALETGGKWCEFLKKYSDTYPLTNECVMELAENYKNPQAYELLKENLQKYGYNEQVGLKVCEVIFSKDFDDVEFIDLFCKSGRIYYPSIACKLYFISMECYKQYVMSTGEYMGWSVKKDKPNPE